MTLFLHSHGHRPFNAPWDGYWSSVMVLTDEQAEPILGGKVLAKDFCIVGCHQANVTALYSDGAGGYRLLLCRNRWILEYVEESGLLKATYDHPDMNADKHYPKLRQLMDYIRIYDEDINCAHPGTAWEKAEKRINEIIQSVST